jgi:hypothetical protein
VDPGAAGWRSSLGADHREQVAPGGVDLESIFGASGWACTSPAAKEDIQAYGFTNLPNCGSTS